MIIEENDNKKRERTNIRILELRKEERKKERKKAC